MSETEYVYETPVETQQNGHLSMLDELKADLDKPLPQQLLRLVVPSRPGYVITYDSRVDWDKYKRINKEAKVNGEFDELKGNAMLLASQCVSMEINGETIKDDDGSNLTFRSRRFVDMTGTMSTREALRKFFVSDFDVLKSANELLAKAGLAVDDLQADAPLDPTDTSND
jgi:hypothetical protein